MSAVPKLRFKEYSAEWDAKRISNVTNLVTDGTHFSPESSDEGDFKYITSKNIRMGRMKLDDISYVTAEDHRHIFSTCPVSFGDILLTKDGASTGNICLNELTEEFSLLSSVALIKANPDEATNSYLYHYFVSPFGTKQVRASTSGQAITRITLTNLNGFKFYFPSLPEQKKIADFLGAVDEKIAGLRDRERLLTQYKKGVMQKIFTQTLRFKADDGSDFPDWEESKLGDISELLKDGTHGTHPDDPDGKFFLLSAKNIQNGNVVIDSKDRKINSTEYNSIYKSYTLKANDILLSVVGTIGRVAIFDGDSRFAFQRSVAFFRTPNQSTRFVYHLMRGVGFQRELKTRQVVSAQPGIYLGDLAKIPLLLPSLDEQQKIADFLSAIDDKITTISAQVTQMQNFKKGLLQQMFV